MYETQEIDGMAVAGAMGDLINLGLEFDDAEAFLREHWLDRDGGRCADEFEAAIDALWKISGLEKSDRPPPPDLMAGVLPAIGVGTLVGFSGAGKSLAALGLCGAVVTGSPFMGRSVRLGGAIYMSAAHEGTQRFRWSAWCRAHGVVSGALPFRYVDDARSVELDMQIATCARLMNRKVGLIVLDSYSGILNPAEENAPHTANGNLERCREWSSWYRCFVLLIGHPAKVGGYSSRIGGDNLMRGSYVLTSAVDVRLTVEKLSGDGEVRRLQADKVRDGVEGLVGHFDLELMTAGERMGGEPMPTAVFRECAAPIVTSRTRPRANAEDDLLAKPKADGKGSRADQVSELLARSILLDCVTIGGRDGTSKPAVRREFVKSLGANADRRNAYRAFETALTAAGIETLVHQGQEFLAFGSS